MAEPLQRLSPYVRSLGPTSVGITAWCRDSTLRSVANLVAAGSLKVFALLVEVVETLDAVGQVRSGCCTSMLPRRREGLRAGANGLKFYQSCARR